jgi:agmatinase
MQIDALWQAPFGRFIGSSESADDAQVIVLGAPSDTTTCFRPGTRNGPREIRYFSYNLEEYSIEQDREMLPDFFFDAGDLELPFGSAARSLDLIERAVSSILDAQKTPVVLGGEHLISAGVARAIASHHPDACILHIDAHYDLRVDYMGEELSHATALNLCRDALGITTEPGAPVRHVQMGIRSGPRSEALFAREHIPQLFPETVAQMRQELEELAHTWRGKKVYCTFDIDAIDPAFAPGTGTPEAGGLSSRQALEMMRILPGLFDLVAVDLVETNPTLDPSGITCSLVAKMLRELLIAMQPE